MKWLLNIFLTLIAASALHYLGPWFLLASSVICIVQAIYKQKKEPLAALHYELSVGIDEVLNVSLGPLLNLIAFKDRSIVKHWFGCKKHTLSMIYGVNWANLRIEQKALCWLLVELWDRGHFKRAANNYNNLFCKH